MRHCVETEPGSMAMPFSDDEFTVHVRGNMFNGEHPKSAFADFIGRDCAVYVTVNKYSFRSSFEYNKGVLLEGYNLYLADIQLHGAFSL